MFQILVNNTIQITRSDTAYFSLTLYSDINKKEKYELQEGDCIKFTVKKNVREKEILIEKISYKNSIKIESTDTKEMNFGKYVYDMQIIFANGDINTVIEPSIFEVRGEVTQ